MKIFLLTILISVVTAVLTSAVTTIIFYNILNKKKSYNKVTNAKQDDLYCKQTENIQPVKEKEERPVQKNPIKPEILDNKQEVVKIEQLKDSYETGEEVTLLPDIIDYSYLKVLDGKLINTEPKDTYYYRLWIQDNERYYEFYCESNKMKKTLYNHDVVIDPFCNKTKDSIDINNATNIISINPGKLDINNSVIEKTTIKLI